MGVRLNGSTSGYVELNAPAVAGTTTLELPTDSIKPGLVLIAASTFSAAGTVSVNNCFTSTYDNYRVVVRLTGSTSLSVWLRLRAAGTDNSTANYHVQYTQSVNSTNATARLASQGQAMIMTTVTTAAPVSGSWDLWSPSLAANTTLSGQAIGMATAVAPEINAAVASHNVATAFDGFSLIASTGNITGDVYVYGYRKAV